MLPKTKGRERTRREFTAEARRAQSKKFLIKKYFDLCELRVSVVKGKACCFGCGFTALGSMGLKSVSGFIGVLSIAR